VRYHHEELRLNGYHEFHRATHTLKSVPLVIVSLWNSTILAVAAGLQHYYGEGFFEKCIESTYSPIVYVTAFNVAETLLFFIVHGSYIRRVMKFNRAQMPPDALQGINTVTGSVGLMQRGADTTELLEKQADLIIYLRDHNAKLNQKLMQMSNQVSKSNLLDPLIQSTPLAVAHCDTRTTSSDLSLTNFPNYLSIFILSEFYSFKFLS
jgi:hypothetical protein